MTWAMPLISMVIARASRISRMKPVSNRPIYAMLFALRGSSKDDRGQARSKPSGLDGGACEPLPFQRRRRRAHLQDDPAGPAGDHGTIAAADDNRPQIGRKVHLPAVLRASRRWLYRGRLERR